MRECFSHDSCTASIVLLLCRQARRIKNLLLLLMPLMGLLVGSCKISQTTENMYNVMTSAEQFRAALFPDLAHFHGANPAAVYISEARSYVADKPQAMMLLTRDEIGNLFGKPSFHRHDADAEVWQYKTGSCVIDFYFYGQKEVSYIDARRKDQTPASASEESSCLHDINRLG